MANQAADRFLKNLVAVCCRRMKPDVFQIELYRSKLSHWYLNESEWAAAMSKIAAEWTEEGLPSLGIVYGYLKSAQREEKPSGQCFLMFTVGGIRYAKRISDPSRASAPANATDFHLVIPPDMQDRSDNADYSKQVDSLIGGLV